MTAETGSVRERVARALRDSYIETTCAGHDDTAGDPEDWLGEADAALAAVAEDPGLVEVLAREHGCTRPRYGTEPCRGCRDRADVIRAWLRDRP